MRPNSPYLQSVAETIDHAPQFDVTARAAIYAIEFSIVDRFGARTVDLGGLGRAASRTRRVVILAACALVALACAPAISLAGGALAPTHDTSAHEASEAGRWALLIALAFLVAGVPLLAWGIRSAWWLLSGRRTGATLPKLWWGRSLVVGMDNRVSTSKTAALVWTYTLAASLLSFLIARWMGYPGAYRVLSTQGINTQYMVLIGGTAGAAILAKGIVSAQVDSGTTAKPEAESANLAQLVQNDSGGTDLGDVQYLLFNIVALAFFYGEVLRVPQAALPTIPNVLVGLTSVAAAGFVGKKALAGPAVLSEVTPEAAPVGKLVTIATFGIVKSEEDLPALTVKFGEAMVKSRGLTLTTTTTLGVLIGADVPPDAVGNVDITVLTPTGKQASWSGFAVQPTITTPDADLRGHPNEEVEIMTTGVTGLGPKLTGLTVEIDDQRADSTLNANKCLVVTVPEHARPGAAREIVLKTPGGEARRPFEVF